MEEELKRLISENKVIPFVGAGVSKSVKFKNGKDAFINWKELLESFLDHINKPPKVNVIRALLEDEPIDYLEIADKIEQSLNTNYFNKILKQAFDIDYNEIDKSTYTLAKEIWNLNSNLIITTNYDKVLNKACADENIASWDIESIHEQANYLRDGVSKPTVWNLHGHIDNTNNIILTTNKYNELYTENIEHSKYSASLSTLKTVISSKSLLFIGFSLDDEFVKEQINKTINIFGGNNCEHYVLVKNGSIVDTLNDNIKVIYYEDYGQPLIDKINSLKPTDKELETPKINTQIIVQQDTSRSLTTLPPINENFIGRVEDLQTIEEMLKDQSITYIVNGIGGVGKSELSCEYFHRNKHKYKNVAFIEFTKDTSSIEELFYVKFKEQFNLNEDATLDSIIQKLQVLPSKNLLLLDNLETKEDFEKIKALNYNFDLLVTTRITDIDVSNQLNLNTLNDEDAKELFLSIYNKDENIEDILEYLDNHPLFINLTAKSLERSYITLEELRDEIKNDNIYKIDSKDDKTFKEHLEDRFAKQFSNESNNELKGLLQILSIFPSIEIDFKIFEKSIAKDGLRVKLQKLVDRGWLSKKENSYKLHQIIKLFIETDYPLKYNDITFVFDNIAKYIDPKDSILIASQLNEYIPIIEYFLNSYIDIEDDYISRILDSITYLYHSLGQYSKSLSYQERSLAIRKSSFSANSLEVAISYNLLGNIYDSMNIYDKAKIFYQKAINIRTEFLGKHNSHTMVSCHNIGSTLLKERKFNEAEKIIKEVLVIREEYLEDEYFELSSSYNGLASVYLLSKQYDKAMPLFLKAITLREKVTGANHPNTAHIYNNLATLYKRVKNYNKALNYQILDIEILEKVLDSRHPDLAISYNNIALIYYELKECERAKFYIEKSLRILKEYDFYNSQIIEENKFLKSIELNIKKQRKAKYKDKGRYCKDM